MTAEPADEPLAESGDLAAPPPAWPPPDQAARGEPVPPLLPGPGPFRTAVTTMVYVVLVVAAWGVLQLWGLGKAPFHSKGEPREAVVVWEMTHGGGWILPKRNGTEVPSKPPLFHWLGALTSLAHGGVDEGTVRFPSAALSLVALLGVFAAGAALWTPHAGLVSALTLMTTLEWARAATSARVDMVLTCGLEAALLGLLFFLRGRSAGWLGLVYGGVTVALLAKGPVGAVLPVLVALVMLALSRDLAAVRRMRLGTGLLVVLVGAGTWYVLASVVGGADFLRKQIVQENLLRLVGGEAFAGGHRHTVLYLLGGLAIGWLPWTLCLPAVAAGVWRDRRGLTVRDPRVFLLVWSAVVFASYAAAASKRGVYLLGLYPAVALLVGWWWDVRARSGGSEDRWLAHVLRPVALVLSAVLGFVLLAAVLEGLGVPVLAMAEPRLSTRARAVVPLVVVALHADRFVLWASLAGGIIALTGTAWAARRQRWTGIYVGVVLATAAVNVATRQALLPAVASQLSPRAWMEDVRKVVDPSAGLVFYRGFDYGALFYWRGHIPRYHGSWPEGAPAFVLTHEREWDRLPPEARAAFERLPLPADETYRAPKRLVLLRRTAPADPTP